MTTDEHLTAREVKDVPQIPAACGVLSSLLYVALTVIVPKQWEGYSSASQTISELSAIGSPTRSLRVLPASFYTVLVTVFGWGVWKSAGRNRSRPIGPRPG